MSIQLKFSATKMIAVATVLAGSQLAYADSGVIGGYVMPFSEMTDNQFFSNNIIDPTTTTNDMIIASAMINNNNEKGWQLQLTSANGGILKRGMGGAGRQINYQNIQLVKTSGSLGGNLTDPSGSSKSVSSGSAVFDTGAALATSSTVNYRFDLTVDLPIDQTLLEGFYKDTLTLTLVSAF
jgi:hypothetical protein